MYIDKIKNGQNVPSLEVVEVDLIQCSLVDNQYQEHLHLPKSYAYLLNAERRTLVFLKTYNTEFYEIIITFTNQNCIPLEVENLFD